MDENFVKMIQFIFQYMYENRIREHFVAKLFGCYKVHLKL